MENNYDILFTPIEHNNKVFKNKFIFENLTECEFYDEHGNFNDKFLKYYNNLAKTSVGTIISGGFYLGLGNADKNGYNSNFCLNNSNMKKLKKVIDIIHSHGSKFLFNFKSIYGRGDYQNKVFGIFSSSPSSIKSYLTAKMPSIRTSDGFCCKMIEQMEKVAQYVSFAGVDGFVIDATLYSIIGEFSSNEFNLRKYGYFNSIFDLLIKFITLLKKITDGVILIKLPIESFLEYYFKMIKQKIRALKKVKTFDRKNFYNLMKKLVEAGSDGFIFECGTFETEFLKEFNEFQSTKIFENEMKKIKRFFVDNKIKTLSNENPLLIVKDNYRSKNEMCDYYNEGISNMFDVTKEILAANNYIISRSEEKCIKCSSCTYCAKKFKLNTCAINPDTFNTFKCEKDLNKKRILIVGAGISGMVSAINFAKRGACVDVFEKNKSVNNNSIIKEIFGLDYSLKKFNQFIQKEFFSFVNKNKINLFCNQQFTVKKQTIDMYDKIIFATGYLQKNLIVEGVVLQNVFNLFDILNLNKSVLKNKNIVLFINSEFGLKTAILLQKLCKNISIMIKSCNFLKNIINDRLMFYMYKINEIQIPIYQFYDLVRIQEDSVEIVMNRKQNPYNFALDFFNKTFTKNFNFEKIAKSIDMDLFVYEPELFSNLNEFVEILNSNFSKEVFLVGNALKISNLQEEIESTYYVSTRL